ncbi:MAG: hypothetical protein DMF50_05150, partial [Acidobacteria bacterium]
MARIDKLLQAVQSYRADALIMTSGEKVILALGSERRSVSPQVASVEQIKDLLADIVPADLAGRIEGEGRHEFAYAAPCGPFTMSVVRTGASLRLQATPRPKGGNGTPPAPAAPAEASAGSVAESAPAGAAAGSATQSGAARTIESLFVKMVKEDCSDLHLTSGHPPLFRRHGEIVALEPILALSPAQVTELLLSITPEAKRDEFERTHDVDFSHEIAGLARFRCNLFLDRHGMGGVFRVIPTKIATAQDLGLPSSILQLCELQKGLVVVTGPTGSGKSTTLAAMV